uniref:ATP synthase subunit a n=1 Tax=Limnodrilus hoffmeisteri TaxID=76587 RepID=A0A8F2F9T4_9ANNE|nr:ATP synthase F0 subunit 6 [Limnodrilus hoffmeisteri]
MMPDIFSLFDPYMSSTFIPFKFIFVILTPMSLLMVMLSMFPMNYRLLSAYTNTLDVMFSQLSRTMSASLKGFSILVASTFMVVIMLNLMGLIPYCFSLSSHLVMTLSLGLPLWFSLIISSFSYKPKAATAHFLPDGAPDWLNPFLVLIESSSILVRPLTLSFRLAANMTAGHIVLSLLGIYMAAALFSSYTSSVILMATSSFYILFEVAICIIQAYIFCLLVSLYSDDHTH